MNRIFRVGSTVTCPHCQGKKGKTVLLYYWVKCHLCLGIGKFKIEEIVRYDKMRGDTKAKISINTMYYGRPTVKTDWLF